MKKALFVGAILLLGQIANAAAIAWGAANPMASITTSPAGGDLSSYTAYLCVGDSSSATAALTALANGSWEAPAIGVGESVISKPLTENGIVSAGLPTNLGPEFSADTTYSFYVITLDATGQYAMVSSVLEGTPYDPSGPYPAATVRWTAEEFYETSGGWIQVGGDTPVDPDVPEPTALALLALGVAGVALRRRVV